MPDGPPEEHAYFQEALLRTHVEIAGLPREHDRFVRSVDPLLAELCCRPPQALPRVAEVFRQVARECSLGRRPAVVGLAGLDPLLAVVALVAGHWTISSLCFFPSRRPWRP